jgi:hypothetical protein
LSLILDNLIVLLWLTVAPGDGASRPDEPAGLAAIGASRLTTVASTIANTRRLHAMERIP